LLNAWLYHPGLPSLQVEQQLFLKMHILFVVPYVPNLIRVRPYNLIRCLIRQGHKVTVMTLSTHEALDVDHLKNCGCQVHAFELPTWRSLINTLTALPGRLPLQSSYSWHPTLADSLIKQIQSNSNGLPIDVIHIEHLRGARYGLHLLEYLAANNLKIPVVWDSVDCITYLFEQASMLSGKKLNRLVTRLELGRTRNFEASLVTQFDRVLVTSEIDKTALVSLASASEKPADVTVLPNGVDLAYFQPDRTISREAATLVVSGKMSYHANVTMVKYLVEDIMPLIWDRRPEVKLWIVGKKPAREIRALAENSAITVTGTVDDIRPYLQSATIAVAPITYGAGIQNKILEAMACATPVVTTPHAITALAAQVDRDLLVASQATELAEKIIALLEEPEQRRKIGENGRRFVEQNHNWEKITDQLTIIYSEMSENNKSRNFF
jgi:polysaccharide biosynthesis protein PslH